MLQKFSVKGFRCFKKKLVFDLTKAHDYEFNSHLIHNGIISSGIIYGKNGSGKSCLGFALFDIVGLLTDNHLSKSMLDESAYINADSSIKYASFEYEFLFNNSNVTYSYKKSSPDKIESEIITVDGKTMLKRTKAKVLFDDKSSLSFPELPITMSAVRYIYRNTPLPKNHPIAEIVKFSEKMLWFRSLQGRGYCGYTRSSENLIDAIYEMEKVNEFQKFLKKVAGINMKLEISQNSTQGIKTLNIRYGKRTVDFTKTASTGTQELLLLFYWITVALDDVNFLYIDEFDAFYHFELAAKIIELITKNSNNSSLQAFFTSHNTYLANNEIMRPDCYFILSNGKITSFADSTERELREGHNLEKLLRSGEFGG